MDPIQDWPKLLLTYGPFALIVFIVYVVLKRAKPTPQAPGPERKVQLSVYVGAWALVFSLAIVIVLVWWKLNLPAQAVISGTIRGLQEPESVRGEPTSIPFFLRKVYKDQTHELGHYDYEWRIITEKKGLEPLIFDFQDESGKAKIYRLDIEESFYHNKVDIVYHRDHGSLVLRKGDQEKALPVVEAGLKHLKPLGLMSVVYAQSTPSISDISRALTSDDPIIRRNARDVLAQQGTQAIPYISSALTSTDSSYRTKLGVITALNKMKRPDARGISDQAKLAILQLAMTEQDQTLRAAARQYIGSVDPGVGQWKLNVTKSKQDPAFQKVVEERRTCEYDKDAEIFVTSLKQKLANGEIRSFEYGFVCDGKPVTTASQTVKCTYQSLRVIEGETDPPKRYYRNYRSEVSTDGKMLTIDLFSDAGHTKSLSTLVYDRTGT